MDKQNNEFNKKYKPFSRKKFLCAGLLLPFLSIRSMGRTPLIEQESNQEDEFTTMLTSKGGVMRVRKTALKKAKVIEKNMSNKSLQIWLKLKR